MIKLRVALGAILISMGVQASVYAANPCARLLSGAPVEMQSDITAEFIAYLSALLEHQIIGDSELTRIVRTIEKGEVLNPIQAEKTWISSSAMIHWDEIQKYISTKTLDAGRILNWSKKNLREKERIQDRRKEAHDQTRNLHQEMEFNSMPGGTFQMGDTVQTAARLTHPFEMMSTAVTQKQWVELMGENPSNFTDGAQTITTTINGKEVKMQPDNPVEQVTWWSAVEYANRLSIKIGLKPAYDLSDIKFKKGTRAENGTLVAESGFIKINAADENIYLALGYRLPTEAEFEYVLRGLNNPTCDEIKSAPGAYVWHSRNSDRQTHPVAQLAPLMIDGKAFYDLLGNVWEWTHGWSASLNTRIDPQGLVNYGYRGRRGGSIKSNAYYFGPGARDLLNPDSRNEETGFRLVRTTAW